MNAEVLGREGVIDGEIRLAEGRGSRWVELARISDVFEHAKIVPGRGVGTGAEPTQSGVIVRHLENEYDIIGGCLFLVRGVALRAEVPVAHGFGIILPRVVAGPCLRLESDPWDIAVLVLCP